MKALVQIVIGIVVLGSQLSAQEPLGCAAGTHLARRGDYTNGTTAATDHGVWEWEIGSGTTYSNVEGISADGNFYATRSLVDPQFALGAFDTVNLLVGRYNADPGRPYAQDVELLLDACEFDPAAYGLESPLDNSAYCVLGVQYYSRVVGQFPNPYDNVDRHITAGRGSLSGWDVGAHIRTAWRAGFVDYAQGMADRILARRPDWEHVLLGGYDYTEASWGALVRVILEMHAAGDISPADYAEGLEMAGELIAAQAPDGSWGQGDYQSTAYALLGLRADPWNFTLPWQQAIIYGGDFLEATATPAPTCGWSYPPEYGEMNSEAISALAVINTLPFVDGFETGGTTAWSSSVAGTPVAPRVVMGGTARIAALPMR